MAQFNDAGLNLLKRLEPGARVPHVARPSSACIDTSAVAATSCPFCLATRSWLWGRAPTRLILSRPD